MKLDGIISQRVLASFLCLKNVPHFHIWSFIYRTELNSHIMYLPIEDVNISIAKIWTAFALERRDNQTDDLPMMDSIVWPIGIFITLKILFHRFNISIYFRNWNVGRVRVMVSW